MKRGTTPTLRVKIESLDLTKVSQVEFLLKQDNSETCTVQVLKTYPGSSVTLDATTGIFSIKYTAAETRNFTANSMIYMDVRPVLNTGDIVATALEKVRITPTLYAASSDNINIGGE